MRETDISHSGTARTKAYDVDATSTTYEQHGWDIHALSAGRTGAEGAYHQSRQLVGSAATPGDKAGARTARPGPA